jgi:heterodisulfide reductase subunit A
MSRKRSILVVGAGIAGIRCSLDLAMAGFKVFLVERNPRIGGHVPLLSFVSPTLEEAQALTKTLIQNVTQHPDVKILSYSEIEDVSGSLGDFTVKIQRKARFVDEEKCTCCGECDKACPVIVSKTYEMGIGKRKAIYLPYPYSTPNKYLIDKENCLYFKNRSCRACRDICPEKAVNFEQEAKTEELNVDAIIVATGFKPYDAERKGQYKYSVYVNVITGMEYERLCSPDGPTRGNIVRIDNGEKPKSVVFLLCIGSREERNNKYCCRVGCVNALKHAYLLKRQYGDTVEAYICYTDIRAVGRGAEEFYQTVRASNILLVHGEPSEIRQLRDKTLTLDVYDQATSKLLSITADMVVLETGLVPQTDLHEKLKIPIDKEKFFKEKHPKLATNETLMEGIFLAGSVQQPMNIEETLAHASAAALKAMISTSKVVNV